MGLKTDVFADYEAVVRYKEKPHWAGVFLMLIRSPGFRAVFFYRIGHRLRRRGLRFAAGLFDRLIWVCGVDISTSAEIGKGLLIPHAVGIVVGHRVKLGERVRILQGVSLGGSLGKRKESGQSQPCVGDEAIIGAGAKLLGPIRVGNRVKIGANAVVTSDLPDDCTAVGIPARMVKLGDRRIPLLEQGGELAELLKDLLRRLEHLEDRIGPDSPPGPA